jgi:hypothetical protein
MNQNYLPPDCEPYEAMQQLEAITTDWSFDEDISPKQKKECIEIGKKLNELGGIALMRKAYYQSARKNRAVGALNVFWHGIGEWQM